MKFMAVSDAQADTILLISALWSVHGNDHPCR